MYCWVYSIPLLQNIILFIFVFSSTLDCIPSLTHQRLQLFVVREVELSNKVIEMLVAGIDVSLGPHLAHAVKVVDVDVDKHPEQTRQNLLSHLHEGLREGSTCESKRWRRENTAVNPGWPFAICFTERNTFEILMYLMQWLLNILTEIIFQCVSLSSGVPQVGYQHVKGPSQYHVTREWKINTTCSGG